MSDDKDHKWLHGIIAEEKSYRTDVCEDICRGVGSMSRAGLEPATC
jgi:hypothetical protein